MSAPSERGNVSAHGSSLSGASNASGAGGPYEMTIAGVPLNSPPEVYRHQIPTGAIST